MVSLPEGTSETKTYQWRQTISFQSCQHDESLRGMKPTQMLNVDQIFVMYDSTNQLIRYAMSNKIADVNGEVTQVILVPGRLPVLALVHFLPAVLVVHILAPDSALLRDYSVLIAVGIAAVIGEASSDPYIYIHTVCIIYIEREILCSHDDLHYCSKV